MPIYEYQCDACGQRFEVIQKFSDARVETCTRCSAGPVRRLVSSPAIQFKGTGWYITDYAQKGKTGAETAPAGAKTEEKKADSSTTTESGAKSESTPASSTTKSSTDS